MRCDSKNEGARHSIPYLRSEETGTIPSGLRYQPGVISESEENVLVAELARLPLKPFEFHGYLGNRRVISFGLRYDYARRGIEAVDEPPLFLADLRSKVANFVGLPETEFRQIGVNEYRPGSGIGWHRDKAEFGVIVGVSLLSAVSMRFRKRRDKSWIRVSQLLAPRSVYMLSGEARELWEHSIAPVKTLRYSVTFRTLARTDPRFRAEVS